MGCDMVYQFEKEIVSENKNCYKNRATPHKEPEELFNLQNRLDRLTERLYGV